MLQLIVSPTLVVQSVNIGSHLQCSKTYLVSDCCMILSVLLTAAQNMQKHHGVSCVSAALSLLLLSIFLSALFFAQLASLFYLSVTLFTFHLCVSGVFESLSISFIISLFLTLTLSFYFVCSFLMFSYIFSSFSYNLSSFVLFSIYRIK